MSVTESKAKAPVKTSKKSVNPAESAALKAALEAAQVEMVPLSALVKSPLNVRTIPYPADSVREMADSIMAIGLIQNLVVHSLPDGMSGWLGGRRLAALQQLLSEQRIDAGNRLAYERAMLNENGGVVTRTEEFEPGGQVLSRGEWLTILRVNRSKGR
jgi:ParB family chromosome partitioning protein